MTRNQLLIRRKFRAPPHIWVQIEAIQDELLDELRAVDRQVEALIARRQELVGELRRCRDAFGHVGATYLRRVPLPGDIDAEPAGTRPLSGRELREMASQVLAASARPLHLSEIHRALLAHGFHPKGHPSKAISDALKAEVAAGRVIRTERATYFGPDTHGPDTHGHSTA